MSEIGYTQADLAERTWGSRKRYSTISQYLHGDIIPNWDTVIKLAKALDMAPKELMPSDIKASRLQHALNYVPTNDAEHHAVYIVQCGDFYKIGITTDIARRISNMRSNNPYKFDIILERWCLSKTRALRIERLSHRRLAKWAHSGEWFHISDSEATQVLKIAADSIIRFSSAALVKEPLNHTEPLKNQNRKHIHPESPRGMKFTPIFMEFCYENGLDPNSPLSRKKFKETI